MLLSVGRFIHRYVPVTDPSYATCRVTQSLISSEACTRLTGVIFGFGNLGKLGKLWKMIKKLSSM